MNRKMIVIIVCALGLCGVLGWLKASDLSMVDSEPADSWSNLVRTNVTHTDYSSIARKIRISGILPTGDEKDIEQRRVGTGLGEVVDNDVPDFPQIVAIAIIDGVPQVTLFNDDKTVLSTRSGDKLESGWEILKVDLKNVVASFDGEQHEFSVLSYDPFERGDELVENKN